MPKAKTRAKGKKAGAKAKAKKRAVAKCTRGFACGRSCIAVGRQCSRAPPFKCAYNRVLAVGDNALVVNATCEGLKQQQAIKISPYKSDAELVTHAWLTRDAECGSMVVPLNRGYVGRHVKLSHVLANTEKLPPAARKRLRDIEGRAKQQVLMMDAYDVDASQLLALQRRGSRQNRVVGVAPKQLVTNYLTRCSHPSKRVHNDLHPRNVVMKQRKTSANAIEYYDARLVDFGRLLDLPANPKSKKRQAVLHKLAKQVQARKGW